jgi:hypothetical protein
MVRLDADSQRRSRDRTVEGRFVTTNIRVLVPNAACYPPSAANPFDEDCDVVMASQSLPTISSKKIRRGIPVFPTLVHPSGR